tara:strand:- start:518 stop:805 length:288 start_codon:yes stop_codon:yes gene_type:complete
MNTVEVYKTSKGRYFASERKAIGAQVDILGELLDDLLPHDDKGHVTYVDRHNLLMKMLKKDDLYALISDLALVVEHMQDQDISNKDILLSIKQGV